MAVGIETPESFVNSLNHIAEAVGENALLTVGEELDYYSQDILNFGERVIAVLRPRNIEMLSRGIAAATAQGLTIVPRGGGMSYTSGYLAPGPALLIDTGSMTRVLNVDVENMVVTVEAGITWETLYKALKPLGLRTLAWGTLSGVKATVGGGMSQNGTFWGSRNGTVVDAALSFEIVLADGSIMRTGNGFMRPHGPDLTGLFAADCGALGVKATVTLQMVPDGVAFAYGSFALPDAEALMGAMSEIARAGLASEMFGFDSYLQGQRMRRESLATDAKSLFRMMSTQGTAWLAMKEGAKVVKAGRNFLDDVEFSLHVICEGRYQSAVDADLLAINAVVIGVGGRSVDNSIPKILRSNPFPAVNGMIGPEGERWVPVHAIVPHSQLLPTWNAIQSILENNSAEMKRLDVAAGAMFAAVSPSTCLIEPVLFWPDAMNEIHRRSLEPSHLAKLPKLRPNPLARSLVENIRSEFISMFLDQNATQFQIARAYPLRLSMADQAWSLLQAVKKEVDPRGQMNPGSLGLGGNAAHR